MNLDLDQKVVGINGEIQKSSKMYARVTRKIKNAMFDWNVTDTEEVCTKLLAGQSIFIGFPPLGELHTTARWQIGNVSDD